MSKKANSWPKSITSDTVFDVQDVSLESKNAKWQPRVVTVENISDIPIQVKLIEDKEATNDAINRTGVIIAAGAQKTFTMCGTEAPVAKVGLKLLTGETGTAIVYINAIDYQRADALVS